MGACCIARFQLRNPGNEQLYHERSIISFFCLVQMLGCGADNLLWEHNLFAFGQGRQETVAIAFVPCLCSAPDAHGCNTLRSFCSIYAVQKLNRHGKHIMIAGVVQHFRRRRQDGGNGGERVCRGKLFQNGSFAYFFQQGNAVGELDFGRGKVDAALEKFLANGGVFGEDIHSAECG